MEFLLGFLVCLALAIIYDRARDKAQYPCTYNCPLEGCKTRLRTDRREVLNVMIEHHQEHHAK